MGDSPKRNGPGLKGRVYQVVPLSRDEVQTYRAGNLADILARYHGHELWTYRSVEFINMGRGFVLDVPRYRYELAVGTPKKTPRSEIPGCGAKTRKGTPCQARAIEGKGRCRNHGGMSSGPKTEAGRERIRESNRRRAAKRSVGSSVAGPKVAENT